MFYDEQSTIELCEEDPSKIFLLINEGHIELAEKLINNKIVDLNTTDDNGNSILMVLLNKGYYNEVLQFMKNKNWEVNHQNNNGETFAHILVSKRYLEVRDIMKALLKNKEFTPNIMDNKGETILDKSMNADYICTTTKILEDERFDNIGLISFRNFYEKYISNNKYGTISKLNNLEIIVDNLNDKPLNPKLEKLINLINKNYNRIKEQLENNKIRSLDKMIYKMLEACS